MHEIQNQKDPTAASEDMIWKDRIDLLRNRA